MGHAWQQSILTPHNDGKYWAYNTQLFVSHIHKSLLRLNDMPQKFVHSKTIGTNLLLQCVEKCHKSAHLRKHEEKKRMEHA